MTKVRKKIGTIPINDIEQQVQQSTSAAITQMQQDVSDFIDEETAQYPEIGGTFKYIEDPEGRSEIKTDSEGKILSYRDSDGVVHENVGIKANTLDVDNPPYAYTNWSNEKELHIPMPKCIKVNFSGITGLPQAKFVDMKGYMEFWDMQGNYFKKEVILNAQGRSSLSLPKKNIALDICNNNSWDDDDTFKLTIGDWVPQDSFHLKGYMNDYLRCFCPVVYKLYDEVVKTRGEQNDYIWKKALIDFASVTETSVGDTAALDQMNNGARCFPQGIPCIAYLNGEFYGIFSWQLKKHRDNYHMDKKEAKHVHLDGVIGYDAEGRGYNFFAANGDTTQIDWTGSAWAGFEIRNPKNLYLMDGTKYDADTNPGELMDETSQYYDSTNKDHKRSVNVKKYILNLSKVMNILADAYTTYEASSKTAQDIADFKAVFETYFDVDNLVDYLILSDITYNWDGFSSNWQWLTYDGVRWYIGIYDVDNTFGNEAWMTTPGFRPPVSTHVSTNFQYQYLVSFYTQELEARYSQLREIGLIDAEHITSLISSWMANLGNKETYSKELTKWTSVREPDSINRVHKWIEKSISNMDNVYNYNPS